MPRGGSYFHPVGTCRMGIDDLSVVDPELRVHGVGGLRIADGSIMPSIVSGNTNATVYAVAERAATLIGRVTPRQFLQSAYTVRTRWLPDRLLIG